MGSTKWFSLAVVLSGCVGVAEMVGESTTDAGVARDAGTQSDLDAGVDAGLDAGQQGGRDAGVITPGDAGPADVTVSIDSSANVRPISRYIYGKNFNGTTWAQEPHLTLNRLGGNRWSAYNWENNASNAGSDYNYQSDDYLGGGNTAGEAVRSHVAEARTAGGSIIVTVPMLGWVAADKNGPVLNQPIASRFVPTVAAKGAAFAYPPSLTDGRVAQDEFVAWLEGAFPSTHADPAREIFYSLDNEPDLWSSTHSTIHPDALTYAELLDKSVATSAALKAVAPQGKVFGFVSYGFNGYVNLQNAPDGAGRDFTDWFLDGMRSASTTRGVRLLDVLDLHWYPEATGGGVRVIGEETSAAVVAARLQAPRSLWDPGYVETSWITQYTSGQAIALIPAMKAKIAAHYPGTELGFTEYYYGGGAHISGALAEADVLGIFGREGVFAATLWPMTDTLPFITGGFAMFRDFDRAGGAFGDTSVRATTSDVAGTSVYASVDAASADRMVVVLINKTNAAKSAALTIAHSVSFSRAEVFQLTAASATPQRGADVTLGQANALRYSMPAMSVTTLVLRP